MYRLLALTGLVLCLFLVSAEEADAQNCPLDWHPPPCGVPPKPVKPWLQQQIENLEQYHFSAAQFFGAVAAASCFGKVGEPRADQAREILCNMSKGIGAVVVAAQVWESRLRSELNAARDGGTQFVVLAPLPPSFEVEIAGVLAPWLKALAEQRDAIEWLGNAIVESVRATYQCDAWAQYDIRGIECGDNQRAWTSQLLRWQGQQYSGVSGVEDQFVDMLLPDADIVEQVYAGFINALDYDSDVSGWEGSNLQ